MKLAVRAVTALALLALATPALPCGDAMKTTQAEAQPPAPAKEKVAKAEKGAKAQKTTRGAQKTAPATAAN